MSERILVYGATGYTGRLIAGEAAARGLDVVLAGRNVERLKAVAEPLGLETRAFELADPARLRAALEDVAAVLHVAGPFSATAEPMVEACLETRTHYLDVTGEIGVFEWIARRDEAARAAGVVLLPGVGFDVVPSDCLAVHVAKRVGSPATIRIAIAGVEGGVSRGTARTMVEALGDGLKLRRDGVLIKRRPGKLERHFDFGAGPVRALAMPLGDLSTAFHSTGAPDIETYLVVSGALPRLIRATRYVLPLLRREPVQRFLKAQVDRMPEAPTRRRANDHARSSTPRPSARTATSRAIADTPSGYAFTRDAAVEAARRVAAGAVPAGFHTPGTAFGPDFLVELPGCTRHDLDAG
ncbi:MAG: saccharopine dehydrogenase NADP-binding domain-containing protein [Myxococcota bacterium]